MYDSMDYAQLPPPKPGHIHFIGMQTMIAGLHAVYAPLPKIAQDLSRPEDVRKPDRLAEKIVEQEKLAERLEDFSEKGGAKTVRRNSRAGVRVSETPKEEETDYELDLH